MTNNVTLSADHAAARRWVTASIGCVITLAIVTTPVVAFASNTGTGSSSTTVVGGALSVGSIGTMTTLAPGLGQAASGTFPTAQWADATGSGAGWSGTVAISPLSFTGTWTATAGSTALVTTTAGTYSGTTNNVTYIVKPTGSPSAVTTQFSYTSNDATDASGTGTSSNGTATAVGAKGLTITFTTATTYTTSSTYTVLAGTQSATAMVLTTANNAAISSSNTTSVAPLYLNGGTTLAPGSTVGTVNTAGAVKFLSALFGTGASGSAGYYTAAPGVTVTADSGSWAKTYSGSIQYSIVTGP